MATATPPPPTNGTATVPSNPTKSSSPAVASGRSQSKANASGKMLDGARKQAASPVDGTSRKPSAPKAWSQGTNPITQRSSNSNAPNGVHNLPAKNGSNAARFTPPVQEGNNVDKSAHDRLLFLIANFTGLDAQVVLKNGEQYTGIFSGGSFEPSAAYYTLKMVKKTGPHNTQQANGVAAVLTTYVGEGDEHVMAFDSQDVIDLAVSNVETATSDSKTFNGTLAGFKTDADISGTRIARERELLRWEPDENVGDDLALEESNGTGSWDQFATNKRMYNVQSDYDENIYTTTIDRTNPLYAQRAAHAERIAREIETSNASNAHVAEERRVNSSVDAGLDEEDRYSGVQRDTKPLRSGGPNTYLPPARRPLTSQPTVAGAPFDPAIISSQLARHSPAPSKATEVEAATTVDPQPQPVVAENIAADASIPNQSQAEERVPAQPTTAPLVSNNAVEAGPSTSGVNTPTSTTLQTVRAIRGENATDNVEKKVLSSFKEFANVEKMKVQEHVRKQQELKRNTQRHEKSVKLNDLKKFSQNFKLPYRVPQDLVPILAKDKVKQDEIVEKAEQRAQEVEERRRELLSNSPAVPPSVNTMGSTSQHVSPAIGRADAPIEPPPGHSDRPRGRMPQGQRQMDIQSIPPHTPRGPGLGPRLAANQAQTKAARAPANVPHAVPPQSLRISPPGPSPPTDGGLLSPTSSASAKFNAQAMEFRPNPAAQTFAPKPSTGASPPRSGMQSPATAATPKDFFGSSKPKAESEKLSFCEAFHPLDRLIAIAKEEKDEKRIEENAANGGVPPAYTTHPTWKVADENMDKTFADMFRKSRAPSHSASPMHTPVNGPMPHAHQLPLHLQNANAPSVHTPQHTPRIYHSQPHHGHQPQFDDHRMQFTNSSSFVQPSPRVQIPAMAYNQQFPPHMPPFAQGMPPHGMSPGGQFRHAPPPGAQFVGHQSPFIGAQMMAQQHSNGPFMNAPGMPPHQMQMPMYHSPIPGQPQPQFPGTPQSGYPSPRPGGHAMSHQGSQQGHPGQQGMFMMGAAGPGMPVMMGGQHPGNRKWRSLAPAEDKHTSSITSRPGSGLTLNLVTPMRNYPQPQYAQNPHPHPQHQYQMQPQHRGMSGGNFGHHMTPRQQHATPQQIPSPGHHNLGPGAGDGGK
ncbi:poly(A)-binding protein binding protein [Elasticomyces elasticus]|nr:poly(A)-binding protein binding protein [Elasticomyces elasticus]